MDITIAGLTKSYKDVKALDDINLFIRPGIHGLLGPNGAGKTTLMRILATISSGDEGQITWGDTFNWAHPLKIKGKIGYLPQQFGMYKSLKVKEALENIALLKNIPKNEEKLQVQLALERTNLVEYQSRKVGQLSGGMLRRLGIAQALLGEPNLVILDEPSVGLDPSERINLRKLMRDYDNGERIIFLSSHIVGDIESLCDSVTVMNKGRIIFSGTLADAKAAANGHIFEESMTEKDFRGLEQTHTIINFSSVPDGYRVRYLANEGKPGPCVDPTLEDSYTYIIQER